MVIRFEIIRKDRSARDCQRNYQSIRGGYMTFLASNLANWPQKRYLSNAEEQFYKRRCAVLIVIFTLAPSTERRETHTLQDGTGHPSTLWANGTFPSAHSALPQHPCYLQAVLEEVEDVKVSAERREKLILSRQ